MILRLLDGREFLGVGEESIEPITVMNGQCQRQWWKSMGNLLTLEEQHYITSESVDRSNRAKKSRGCVPISWFRAKSKTDSSQVGVVFPSYENMEERLEITQ